ncbi:Cytokinin dehydrogenase 3 [Bienertia sinuspersici]
MAKETLPFLISSFFIIMFLIISRLMMSIIGVKQGPWSNLLPCELFFLDISSKLSLEKSSLAIASTDFGNLVHKIPAAMFYPSSVEDIVSLVKFSYKHSSSFSSFKIAARGRGHSCRGQAMVENGIVIDMPSLNVGGEQLWIDVLQAALEHGVAPVSWTDYLYLSVGGTLSNAGIGGQAFRYGPQISNVLELDVVTGKGDFISCSKTINTELFYAVLGGLGQFGIITRARIKLETAPKRVKWVRMLYDDFSTFTRDQEQLISVFGNYQEDLITINEGVNYVEGSLVMHQADPNNWRSSFFSSNDQAKIASLNVPSGLLYCLEVAKYYYNDNPHHITNLDKELGKQLEKLNFIPGYIFTKEVTFVEFLNRVRKGELELQSKGLWEVPHPWLNIFIPTSQILDFYPVITHIIANHTKNLAGPILIYPLNRNKYVFYTPVYFTSTLQFDLDCVYLWDDKMSAITPEEDVFYTVGLLHSSGFDDWKTLESKNEEILKYCHRNGIKIKQYLPHYTTMEDWKTHFGSKWNTFQHRKISFDPKLLLSPGQNIFNTLSNEDLRAPMYD